jgi:hypothetical protein
MAMHSTSAMSLGGNFTHESLAEKTGTPEHDVRTTEAIAQILGPYEQLQNGELHKVERGVFVRDRYGAFQSGISHGNAQVMRDQICRRSLDMPIK